MAGDLDARPTTICPTLPFKSSAMGNRPLTRSASHPFWRERPGKYLGRALRTSSMASFHTSSRRSLAGPSHVGMSSWIALIHLPMMLSRYSRTLDNSQYHPQTQSHRRSRDLHRLHPVVL